MEDRHFSISITTGTVVKTLLVLLGAWLLFILRDIALVVLTAIVIASAIDPGVRSLTRYGLPRVLAVILVYLMMFGLFFVIFYFFLPSLLEDLATFITSVPTYLNAISQSGAFDHYTQMLGFPSSSSVNADDIIGGVRDALNLGMFDNAFSAAAKVFGGVFSFVLIMVFSFYFAVIETGVDEFIRVVTPKKHQSYVQGLWIRSRHKIGLWMQGQLLLGLIMGILVYLGLTILGVKHALVLAVIVAVFEIIPVFGPILAAIPAVAIAFVDSGATLGLLTIALYVIAQQFENHLIYPLVVTRVVGVPPLLVILALVIGAQLAGFLGIILSVPVAATIQEFIRDMETGRLREHEHKVAA
ncbi:MAG: AI-2E family transporter [bacterium]|nr:AI-2E family transporter [bacterium]